MPTVVLCWLGMMVAQAGCDRVCARVLACNQRPQARTARSHMSQHMVPANHSGGPGSDAFQAMLVLVLKLLSRSSEIQDQQCHTERRSGVCTLYDKLRPAKTQFKFANACGTCRWLRLCLARLYLAGSTRVGPMTIGQSV